MVLICTVTTVESHLQRREEQVSDQLDVDISVYGVGHGYRELNDYLRGEQRLTDEVRKQAHQYWIFLQVLPEVADSVDDDQIFFRPSKGTGVQFSIAPSVFAEPALPVYPEEELWEQYKDDLAYLRKPGVEDNPKHHTKPDLLVMDSSRDRLPWTARGHQPVENESQLMSFCANGKYEEVAEELDLEVPPTTGLECYTIVQNLAPRTDSENLYEQWTEVATDVGRLIECKNNPLNESDYSQILWYGIAYKRPLTLVSVQSVVDSQFLDDLDRLPIDVDIIDNVDVGDNIDILR